MKLKVFNTENCAVVKTGTPMISLNLKSGLVAINRFAVDQMQLSDKDQVIILQDEDSPADWYLEKAKEKGFQLRKKDNVSAGLFFNNVALIREIAKSVSYKENSGRLLIAGQPTKIEKRILWGLLTVSLRKK